MAKSIIRAQLDEMSAAFIRLEYECNQLAEAAAGLHDTPGQTQALGEMVDAAVAAFYASPTKTAADAMEDAIQAAWPLNPIIVASRRVRDEAVHKGTISAVVIEQLVAAFEEAGL